MDSSHHTLAGLFSELGLENNQENITNFLIQHNGIPSDIRLDKADIWSHDQAEFLKDSLTDNSDWAAVVEMLDTLLR